TDLARYVDGATIQTDGRLSLEFSAPRAVYGQFEQDNVKRLRALASTARPPEAVAQSRATATADEWRHRAQMDLSADSPHLAYDEFLEALARAPNDSESLDGLARAAAASGRLPDAEAYLAQHGASGRSVAALIELSKVLAARGEAERAAITAQRAAAMDPSNTQALEQLIVTLADSGNDAALEQLSALVKQSAPEGPLALRSQMRLAYLRSDYAHAARVGERLASITTDPVDRARTLNLVGSAYEATGDYDRARKAFQESLAIAARDSAVLVNLGMTELRSSNAKA